MSKERQKSEGAIKAGSASKTNPSRLVQFLVAVGFLAIGILLMYVLIKSRKPPERVEQKPPPPLVEVERLKVRDVPMVIRGNGTVSPKVQVEIVPQVSGNAVFVNRKFKAGGFVPAGELILQIDPRDSELAVQQARALVADAQVKLDLERAEAGVARAEWKQLNPDTEPTSPLVLREPQIRQAQAALESAKARLAAAELSLERTRLSLPIDVVIISEKVDLGQYVVTGQSLGSAYGIETLEIEVPLEDDELAWFHIPGNPVSPAGGEPVDGNTVAHVKADFAGAEHTWRGYVKRTTGQVDRASRQVSVVVEVPEPFRNSDSRPPLVPGMFVEVFIEGKVLKNAVAVPRDAVHNGNEVWVVEDGLLRIQPLDIVRTDKDFVYAKSGLEDGAAIAVSALDIVTNGMRVRARMNQDTDTTSVDENIKETNVPGAK